MTLKSLLNEYNLTLDDVRWYLSRQLTDSILTNRDDPEAIAHRIWSGALEAELYNMEETYINRLQDESDRGIRDEQAIRDELEQARILKIQRGR